MKKIILYLIFITLLTGGNGQEVRQTNVSQSKIDTDMKNIIETLQQTQSWLDLGKDDDVARAKITATYIQLSHYDNDTIRATLVKIESEYSFGDLFQMGAKIFAWLRIIFNVPPGYCSDEVAKASVVSGRCFPAPVKDGRVDMLWPYTLDDNGNLILVKPEHGVFIYSGSPYSPTKDFDFMVKFYERRAKENKSPTKLAEHPKTPPTSQPQGKSDGKSDGARPSNGTRPTKTQ